MNIGRRDFLASSTAFAVTGGLSAYGWPCGSRTPTMRLGMISDTHLVVKDNGWNVQNSLCFEPALRYFDQRKADGVLVAGDLTDFGTASCLRYFASIWNHC